MPVAPDNAGPKTFPNYANVADQAIRNLRNGGKTFVGPVDDPFFIDLGVIFDGINIDKPGRPMIGLGNQGGGKDDVSGYNTHAFALQVPFKDVTRDGRDVKRRERRQLHRRHLGDHRAAVDERQRQRQGEVEAGQPDREPARQRGHGPDRATRTSTTARRPARDRKNFRKYVANPELAKRLNQLFNLGIKENDRDDIVQALLTGVPGLTQISPRAVPADTLKVNLGVPPTATPNRFGVLAGDTQGFPNGRRLADDVTDIELRVLAGALLKPEDGRQAAAARRRRRPEREAVPHHVPVRGAARQRLRRQVRAHRARPRAGSRADVP